MIRALLPLLFPVLLLAGCAQSTPPPSAATPINPAGGARCKADGLGDLIGKPATGALGADALRRSGARALRWIQPGTLVTMDFRYDRLNIHLDKNNVVTSRNCG